MAGERSYASLGATSKDLDAAASERLADALALFQAGRHASSIAMGIYALEIRLKERICGKLDLRALPRPFEVHELEGLLVLSGLSRKMNQRPARRVKQNWNEIRKLAKSVNELRYKPGSRWSPQLAGDVLKWLTDPSDGVLTWISNQP